jgi:putative SbcD/Mre11-related phosphoesterase
MGLIESTKDKSNSKDRGRLREIGHPIHNEPAFLIERPKNTRQNVLVLADIHYGIEHNLAQAGARLPSHTGKITDRIIDLCSKYKVTNLVLLGDIKHTVPTTSRQEWYELPEVFERLAEAANKIDIIPGNHDGNLRRLIPSSVKNVQFHPASGTVLYGIGLFHGHTWPDPKVFQANQVLMAHNHPSVLFMDRLGGQVSYSCWFKGRLDIEVAKARYPKISGQDPEIIIMPAFNDIGTGTPVNAKRPEFLGPLLKNKFVDLNSAKIYLLDGTDLGKLDELVDLSLV